MILDKHILRFEDNVWWLTLVEANTDRVICSYAFTSQQDAETAAEIAIGIADSPSVLDLTYDELIHEVTQFVCLLNERGYSRHNKN